MGHERYGNCLNFRSIFYQREDIPYLDGHDNARLSSPSASNYSKPFNDRLDVRDGKLKDQLVKHSSESLTLVYSTY